MKKLFTILAAVLLTASVFAQSPEKMSYQAVIRNTSDALVTNTQIGMQISILQGSTSGTAVYVETQSPTTNANGLVSVEIGAGTIVSGNFAAIDWANGPYFIKTETNLAVGTSYTITGTSQLLSVPYALHAKTAEIVTGGITETDPVFEAWDKSTGISITESQISDLQNYLTTEVDGSVSNEIQVLSISNDTIYLTDGGFVKLPAGTSFSGSFNDLTDVPAGLADGDDDTQLDETAVDAFVANNGYLTSYIETDPIFIAHAANGITLSDIGNWNAAFAWGDHSIAGYESAFSKNTAFNKDFGTTTGTVAQGNDSRIVNGQTAFSWGNHSAAGYEAGFSKNTAFNKNFGTTAGTVAQGNDSRIVNGQTAFGWGNHSSAGYLSSVAGSDIALGGDTQGDIMYYNGTSWVRLGAGTPGQVLQTNGAGSNPSWTNVSGGSSNSAVIKNSNYTIQAGENVIISNAVSTITFTLPTAATAGSGAVLHFYGMTNEFNIITSESIYDLAGVAQSALNSKFIITLVCDGVNKWYQIQ